MVGCASTTTKARVDVVRGMSSSDVSGLLGNPDSRSFRGLSDEAWQYHDIVGYGQCEYVTIFFRDEKVLSMTSRRGGSISGCGLGSRPVNWAEMQGPRPSNQGGAERISEPPLEPTGNSGSCFFISGDGKVATNYHVVGGKSRFDVIDAGGKIYSALLKKSDPSNDLALLKVDATNHAFLEIAPFRSLKMGQEIFVVGYPVSTVLGIEPKFTDGVISSTAGIRDMANMFQMTAPIQPGNSGAPVLNVEGQVVGVATSTAAVSSFLKNTGTLPQNINWAVKSEYLGLLVDIQPGQEGLNSKRLAIDAATKASCRVQAR